MCWCCAVYRARSTAGSEAACLSSHPGYLAPMSCAQHSMVRTVERSVTFFFLFVSKQNDRCTRESGTGDETSHLVKYHHDLRDTVCWILSATTSRFVAFVIN